MAIATAKNTAGGTSRNRPTRRSVDAGDCGDAIRAQRPGARRTEQDDHRDDGEAGHQ